ncbi:unnamed protein product [Bemisia tabaci]|uniref:Malonyl-CoA:ACP transacylase (MAT) domain-containing protein n=1 Tax=Bemisia tabaci TaxID=7038 RepID=A0A9P0CE18_BEMTA|nr:unnamed protein product [Bemisia tabaci]
MDIMVDTLSPLSLLPISTSKLDEKLPQLILLSSRTENGIEDVFRRLRTTKATPEFAFLLNNVFRKAMKGHMYRGFTMASPGIPNIPHKTMKVEKHDRPIWYVFSGMGSQWPGMGLLLLHVPVFRAALERCDRVLKPRGIDIFEVLTSKDEAINDNIIHSFVAISSVQIGLTEVLRALKLEPNGVIGHSVGELGCAYADNCLTIEQTILSAYARGKAVMESTLIEGTMAAVGLGYHDIRDSVPKSIDIGCRNSSTSCTISGPAADVEAYVSKLTSKGVFAKNVSASGIAYHSRYLEPAAPLILKYLREHIRPTGGMAQGQGHCSPEYHLNNMMSPVLFEDVLKRIPSHAVVIEIAPHGLLQAILKREIPDRAHVPLTKRSTTGDGARFLLDAIGQMYLLGLEPDVNSLYPPIQFPVPCDTPSLQPFVTWEHSEAYPPPEALRELVASRKLKPDKVFTLGQVEDMLKQYEKKGIPVLQLSLFLAETWKLLSAINKKSVHELPVIFEDVQTFSEINFSTEGFSNIWVQILPGAGDFAVFQEFIEERPTAFGMETRVKNKNNKDTLLMQGKIVIWEEPKKTSQLEDFLKNNEFYHTLKSDEFSEGSKIDYFINSVVRHFECDGVTVDLFKTQPIREELQSLHNIQTEHLTFVPYAENSFKDQYEFVRTSLQLIVENSGKVGHTNDEPLEIQIFGGNNEKEYSLLLKMFTEVLRSDDNDLKVKLTPTNLPKISESNLKANLHFVSDLRAVTALAPSNDSIISYIFVTIPAKIHMKDVLDAALRSNNHYELVFEQIFGSLRFGLLKTIIPEKELRVFQVTNNLSSTLELLKSEKILEDENVILVIPNSQFNAQILEF